MENGNTTKQLLRHLFDTMRDLKENKTSVEDAKAQANLVKQANNVLKYELDKAIAYKKYDGLDVKDIES